MGAYAGPTNFLNVGAAPSLMLNFARDKNLKDKISGNDLITFTRSSTGTYVGSDGLIKTAAANVPRFDHTTSGTCLGLLLEESRTNIATYSADFANAIWTKQNGFSITSNTATAPDGTLTADTASRPNLATDYLYQNLVHSPGTYTLSCWVRSVTGTAQFNMSMYNGTDGTQASQTFTATTSWQRFSHTGTMTANVTGFYPCVPAVSNEQFYIWGAQVEAGSFATSYIPTVASTVTRSIDSASITGTNFNSWYNSTQGTITCNGRILKINPATYGQIFWSIGDSATFNESMYLTNDPSQTILSMNIIDGGSGQISQGSSTVTDNSFNKTVIAYKANDTASSFNGSSPTTDTSCTLPTVNSLKIGNASWSVDLNSLNGTISQLFYYPARISNTKLQQITQIFS